MFVPRDHIILNFLKTISHKIYPEHSCILCLIYLGHFVRTKWNLASGHRGNVPLLLLTSQEIISRISPLPVTTVFLKISQNSQGNTCSRVSFLIKMLDTPSFLSTVLPFSHGKQYIREVKQSSHCFSLTAET